MKSYPGKVTLTKQLLVSLHQAQKRWATYFPLLVL